MNVQKPWFKLALVFGAVICGQAQPLPQQHLGTFTPRRNWHQRRNCRCVRFDDQGLMERRHHVTDV